MNEIEGNTRREVIDMAKDTLNVEEIDLEDLDLDADEADDETEETPQGTRPVDLAKELGVNPKHLRAWLRRTFPRPLDEKNTSWFLTDSQVNAAIEFFTADEDDDESTDEDE